MAAKTRTTADQRAAAAQIAEQRDRQIRDEILAREPMRPETPQIRQWRDEGRVVSTRTESGEMYPEFQFDGNLPKPAMGTAIALLEDRYHSAWQIIVWFTHPTARHLDDVDPIHLLDSGPEPVAAYIATWHAATAAPETEGTVSSP
jgi:hypothetical protein